MSKRRQVVHIQYSSMSAQTKQFLQKICYKETASVDMTRYGFVNDSHPVRLFMKPLRKQLEKIHGKQNQTTKTKYRRDKSVDEWRHTTPSRMEGPHNQVNEKAPTDEFENELEKSIYFLISQQKEQKRQINKKIEESIAKENLKTKKRNRKSSQAEDTDSIPNIFF